MDDERFASLMRSFTAGRLARRRALQGLLAAPLAFGLAALGEVERANARKRHKKKGKKHRKRKGGSGNGGDGGDDGDGGGGEKGEEALLLDLINDHRAANGQAALVRQGQLDAAAERYSRDQAENGATNHIGSDGSSPDDRIADAGYAADWWGENIYYNSGDGSAATAFDWWKNSPGHNANMLSAHFEEIGIARVQNEETGYWYWTTDFASPA